MLSLNIENILFGYRQGIFPMAESKKSKEIFWVKPKERGIIPIGKLHISKNLKKFVKNKTFRISINTCFQLVVKNCADRPETWINNTLINIYQELYRNGHAHSIEVWLNDKLIGGLFGIAFGSCFCGESMYSSEINGSKLALIATMYRLRYNKFKLFDTQFPTDHLRSMGGLTIPQEEYEKLLSTSVDDLRNFLSFPNSYSWSEMVQLSSHKL